MQAIRTGERAKPDFEHALKRHRLIDAIARASQENRAIPLG